MKAYMSHRMARKTASTECFVTPGEAYRVLAPSSSLREHLSDSYWCAAMNEVCEGQLDGVAVRYTGQHLVFLQFRPKTLSPAGYRYPLSMSIPAEYLVPLSVLQQSPSWTPDASPMAGSFPSSFDSIDAGAPREGESCIRLCVVCGRYNVPGMVRRHHGYKCRECVGKKSTAKLRRASHRQRAEEEEG